MKKSEYEKLLKRIDIKDPKTSNDTDSRFVVPPVDVMWEGQRTILRNFSDYPKIMRREILQRFCSIYQKNLQFQLRR